VPHLPPKTTPSKGLDKSLSFSTAITLLWSTEAGDHTEKDTEFIESDSRESIFFFNLINFT